MCYTKTMRMQIDKKNVLLVLVVLLLIISSEIAEFREESGKDQNTRSHGVQQANKNALQQVVFTNEGFTPSEIHIRKDTTVVWTSQSKNPMWVASDPHPSHTDLSGFDQKEILNAKGIYRFTFTKTGTWKYHNHIIPSFRGKIIVSD